MAPGAGWDGGMNTVFIHNFILHFYLRGVHDRFFMLSKIYRRAFEVYSLFQKQPAKKSHRVDYQSAQAALIPHIHPEKESLQVHRIVFCRPID